MLPCPGSTLVVAPSGHLVCRNEATKGYQSQRLKTGNRWPRDAVVICAAIRAAHLLRAISETTSSRIRIARIADLKKEQTMPAHIRKMLIAAAMISAAP